MRYCTGGLIFPFVVVLSWIWKILDAALSVLFGLLLSLLCICPEYNNSLRQLILVISYESPFSNDIIDLGGRGRHALWKP